MIRFTTETGSLYVIDDELEPWLYCRLEHTHDLRGDGEWIELKNRPEVKIGYGVTLISPVLDPPQFDGAEVTIRHTSSVAWIEGQ